MVFMSEAPRYPVATLEQMAEIPLDALPRFLAELPALIGHMKAIKAIGGMFSELELGTIETQEPVWIDDNLHTGTSTFSTPNGEEIASFEFDTRTGERPAA